MSNNVSVKLSEWFISAMVNKILADRERLTTEKTSFVNEYSIDVRPDSRKKDENCTPKDDLTLSMGLPTSIVLSTESINDEENWSKAQQEMFASLNWRGIEVGEPTEAEYIIEDLIRRTTSKKTMEWLYNLFLDNTGNALFLCTLIHSLSHIEYELVYPQGPMMAMAMFAHSDKRVVGYAIKAFSNWNSKDSLKYIKDIQPKEVWAKREMQRVIDYIKINGDDINDVFDEKNHTSKMDTRTA